MSQTGFNAGLINPRTLTLLGVCVLKSDFATFLGASAAAVAAVRPHYLPFVRSLGSRALETTSQKKAFSASVEPASKELSICVAGKTISVPVTLWERYLGRYLETIGDTHLSLYRECGPLRSYLVLITDLFFLHLRDGPCECFGRSSENIEDAAFQRQLIQLDKGVTDGHT